MPPKPPAGAPAHPSLLPPGRPWLLLAVTLGGGIALALIAAESATMLILSTGYFAVDFAAYWSGASNLAAGRSPYDWLAQNRPPTLREYTYPPFLAALLAPLAAHLDFRTASVVWFLFSLLCLLLGIAVAWQATGIGRKGRGWLGLLVLLPLMPWYVLALGIGQLTPQLLLLVAGGYAALGARRPGLAGALIVVAGYLKVFPALLGGYLLLRREWRAFAVAAGVGLAFIAATLVLVGWDLHVVYLTQVVRAQTDLFAEPMNQSVAGLLTRLLVPNPATRPVLAAPGAAQAATLVISVLMVAATGYVVWQTRRAPSAPVAYALVVVASLIVAPINAHYQLPIAALPLLVVAAHVEAGWPRFLPALLGVLALLSLPADICDLLPVRLWCSNVWDAPWRELIWRTGWGNLLQSGPLFGLFALWLLLARMCLSAERDLPVETPTGREHRQLRSVSPEQL